MGEPPDVDGECNAHCYLGDNFGDNHATMRCQLPKGHEGVHREEFEREVPDGQPSRCVMTWERDERCWHDWIDLDTEEGRAAYLGDLDSDMDAENRRIWVEDYEHRLQEGDRFVCRDCHATALEPTTRPLC